MKTTLASILVFTGLVFGFVIKKPAAVDAAPQTEDVETKTEQAAGESEFDRPTTIAPQGIASEGDAMAAEAELPVETLSAESLKSEIGTLTDRFGTLLAELNTLIRHLNEQTALVRRSYPPSFKQIDRKVVFQWTAAPARQLVGWPRNWVAQGLSLNMNEATVRGYVWKVGQGQVTDLGGIESLPSASGRGLRFAMDATPVQICGEGRDVQLAGYLTHDIGIYDESFSAWRTNAYTTVKAVLKGTPP